MKSDWKCPKHCFKYASYVCEDQITINVIVSEKGNKTLEKISMKNVVIKIAYFIFSSMETTVGSKVY